MLEILQITKDDPSVENLWQHILIDSYNYSYQKNNYSKELDLNALDNFWKEINQDSVFITLRQNKAIGFFFIEQKDNQISFKLFVYSRACPLSLRSLLKGALFKTMMIVLNNHNIKTIIFETWHPALVSLVKTYIPTVTINMYSPSSIECIKNILTDDLQIFEKILINNILDFNTINENNNFKVLI